jgi:hypothetical protein
MLEQILEKLQMLDYWSMGIGIILTVVTFFVWAKIRAYKKEKQVK